MSRSRPNILITGTPGSVPTRHACEVSLFSHNRYRKDLHLGIGFQYGESTVTSAPILFTLSQALVYSGMVAHLRMIIYEMCHETYCCRCRHVDVSKMVVAKELHDGYDEEFDSYNINEDKVVQESTPMAHILSMLTFALKVVDELEDIMTDGGILGALFGCFSMTLI